MSRTVLLIEDNNALLENTSEILELANYKVLKATNGKEGLDLARKNTPDIILCDIMMPELDGYGVLRAIGNIPSLKGVPFVFVTARAEKTDFRYGMGLGADDYLTKPYNGEELLLLIETRIKKAGNVKDALKNDLQELEDFMNDETPLQDVKSLRDQLSFKKLHKKDILFNEGENSNNLYYVSSGKIKLYTTNDMGKEYISRIYKEGDFFGYNSLLDEGIHQETAEALEDSEIGMISKQDFFQLLQTSPDISLKFIRNISNDLLDVKENLVKLAYNSARKRVAEALVYLADKYRVDDADTISFAASRNDISALSGISPESVSRNLTDFKEEGLIEISSGNIKIPSIRKLRSIKN